MNLERIRNATTEIKRLKIALAWLHEYGDKVGKDGADVSVRLNFAGSCNGAKLILEQMVSNRILTLDHIAAALGRLGYKGD